MDCIQAACGAMLGEALAVQDRHSSEFMTTAHCKNGRIGAEAAKTLGV